MILTVEQRSLVPIAIAVVLAHVGLLLWGTLFSPAVSHRARPMKVAVRTVTLQPVAVAPLPAKPTKAAAKALPKESKSPVAAKKPVEPKQTVSNVEVKKGLQKLDQALSEMRTVENIAAAPMTLAIEGDYREQIVATLDRRMRLPEYGEIDLHLTLNRQGQIMKIEIDRSQNVTNQNYVLKTLPSMQFPRFFGPLERENTHTFYIQLRNR